MQFFAYERFASLRISEMFDRIIARDLLKRMADERDRRRHLIWLTPKGRRLLVEERRVLCPDKLATALDRMSEDGRSRLVSGLQALIEAATSNPLDPVPDRGTGMNS